MDPARWRAANEIFHSALEVPASERREFVCLTCKGDSELEAAIQRLLEADEKAASYLETPVLPDHALFAIGDSQIPFQIGEILKGRFRIIRHVGHGGMGHVFEAYDKDLNVLVALKVIRPEIARNPIALEYFRREVRLARTITHPNVCRAYDLDRGCLTGGKDSPQEFVFLTMEFLPGETLAAKLKRDGPMAPEDALAVARQVGSALDAAHAVGIVHRDIKPANIMLAPIAGGSASQARAVITDFGLARHNPLSTSVPGSSISHGSAVGTLAYMAPEQLDGSGHVSAATDIYALGLVLFEMVTGEKAFPSASLLSGVARRIAGPPPSLRALSPEMSEAWEFAIQRCLRLVPADRFQSAGQVVEALCAPKSTARAAWNPREGDASATPSRGWVLRTRLKVASLGAAILLGAMSLFSPWFRLHLQEESAKVEPGALVYLTPVRNETGDRNLDNLTELLQAGLEQSVQINLLDQSRVGDTLQRMTKPPDTPITGPVAREIAMRTGAVRVVFATVTGSAGSYRLDIDIQQPDNDPARVRDHWLKNVVWPRSASMGVSASIPPELLAAVRDASDWIRREVGESANDLARIDAPPDEVTTSSWNALGEYENAQRFSLKFNSEGAVQSLRHAVSIDPQFALAYGRLGDVLVSMRRNSEAFEAYDRALNAELSQRLTRRERDRIKGMYAIDTGDMESAERAFRDYTNYYENDPSGWAYRSYPLEMLGRTEEAASSLRHAARLEPNRSFPLNELIACMLQLGRYNDAAVLIAQLREKGFEDFARMQEGQLEFLDGQFESSRASFKDLQRSDSISMRSMGATLIARLEAERGDTATAIEELTQALAAARARNDASNQAQLLLDRASVEAGQAEASTCLSDLDAAVALDPSVRNVLYATDILGAMRLARGGAVSSRLARSLANLAKQMPSDQDGTLFKLARFRVRGEMLFASGDWNGALTFARRAAAADFPAASRDYLGRASLAAAMQVPSAEEKQKLLGQALQAFGLVALHPGLIWSHPGSFPPGFYASQVLAYRRCAIALHDGDALGSAELALRTLHLHPDKSN
jgi:serine/threonine protein kinase/tetratricopeptide (TPR) repeat protein